MLRIVARPCTLACTLGALSVLLVLTGCQSAKPDYSRPLPPGASALRKLPADQWPDIKNAYRASPGDLTAALRKSFQWFGKPSTSGAFNGRSWPFAAPQFCRFGIIYMTATAES